MQYVGGRGVPFEVRLGFDKIFNDNPIGMTDIRSSLTNIVEKFTDTGKYKLTVPQHSTILLRLQSIHRIIYNN